MPPSSTLVAGSARRSRGKKRSGDAAGADLLEPAAFPPAVAEPGPGPGRAGEASLAPASLSR